MVHLLIIKVNSKEIDGVPVGTPVGSRTVYCYDTNQLYRGWQINGDYLFVH